MNISFITAVLLRYTSDLNVWRAVQASILLVDCSMLYGTWAAFRQQGRLDPAGWRPEDWACLGITGFVTVARILFLAGAGLGARRKGAKAS